MINTIRSYLSPHCEAFVGFPSWAPIIARYLPFFGVCVIAVKSNY